MTVVRTKSFAKINLGLEVVGQREDGYHEIATLLQTVSLHDELSFEETAEARIELYCDLPSVPIDQTNLAYRAAWELIKSRRQSNGIRISINKKIPVGAGLGGGSSNAAVTLLVLNRLWSLNLSTAQLWDLARALGADVPFFLQGGSALATGKGDEICSFKQLVTGPIVLVYPRVPISTSEAYGNLGHRKLLTKGARSTRMQAFYDKLRPGPDDMTALFNDFEPLIFSCYPKIGRIKLFLLEHGARLALLSGSGSTVFGIFDEETQARRAMLDAANDCDCFLVTAISHDEYVKSLIQIS